MNRDLHYEIKEKTESLFQEIHHGESFYDKEMFKGFIKEIDELKHLSERYLDENNWSDE